MSGVPEITYAAALALGPSLPAQRPCLLCLPFSLKRTVSRAPAHSLNPDDAGERWALQPSLNAHFLPWRMLPLRGASRH